MGYTTSGTADGQEGWELAGWTGSGVLRRIVDRFYVSVLGDDGLAPYFGAEPALLKWHQAAQLSPVLCPVLGACDRYQTFGHRGGYLLVAVPAVVFHRAAASLIRAVDTEVGSREAVVAVATALAARRCRVVGGVAALGVLMPVEGGW